MLKKYLLPLLIILISLIPLMELLKPGLPLTHDGQDHVARIANFYQNLTEGNVIPRWAGNLNWGYGHPILEFLYPLPSYAASFFHFIGFNLVDSVKIVFGMSFILSALSMYIFIKELLNDKKAAFFASLLYVVAPYRFVDLYVRGAIGEHVAFIFPPLIFYFLLRLSRRYSWVYLAGGAFSFAGLILSHNAITLMFLPIIVLYAFFLVLRKNKLSLIYQYAGILVVGFGISAFFWLPAFAEGKYTLRDIVTGGGEYAASFVAWKDFFVSGWSYGGSLALSKQIGFMHWIFILGSVAATYYFYKIKNKLWILSLGSFTLFWISLFLMTSWSDFIWQSVTILQKFQFPWRLLSVTVFLSSLMGGIILSLAKKNKTLLLLVLVAMLLLINKGYWHANGFLQKDESFYSGIYNGTTDTGESAPIWSVRFMEKRPLAKVQIIDGIAQIQEVKRTTTARQYKINVSERARILENTLYFPGWTVLVDGKIIDIQFQDPSYRGLITFYVGKGNHMIDVSYKETKIRQYSNMISLIFLAAMGGFTIFKLKRKEV